MYKTPLTYKKTWGEVFSGKSLTVPHQAMTVKEIMNRFAKGLPLNDLGKQIYYDDEETVKNEIVDETLNPAFDLADYSAIMNDIDYQVRKRKEDYLKQKADEEEAKRNDEKAKSDDNQHVEPLANGEK